MILTTFVKGFEWNNVRYLKDVSFYDWKRIRKLPQRTLKITVKMINRRFKAWRAYLP
jgi:hypothetical protein